MAGPAAPGSGPYTTPTTTTSGQPLKRLGVVPNTVSKASSLADASYRTARAYVPGVVEPYVKSAEDVASTYGYPVVTAAADYGSKVLQSVDNTVDTHVRNVSGVVSLSQQVHAENLQHWSSAKAESFKAIQSAADYIKSLLNPFPYINAVLDPIKDAVRKTVVSSDPDSVVDWFLGNLSKVASVGPVHKVLKVAEPYQKKVVDTTISVVKSPVYKQVVDTGYGVTSKAASIASSTWFYKKGAELLWPQVAFVAEPLSDKLQKSRYVNKAVDAVRPKAS